MMLDVFPRADWNDQSNFNGMTAQQWKNLYYWFSLYVTLKNKY